jgi:hypothetical protein
MKTENKNQATAPAAVHKSGYRISHGQILNPQGNPVCGWEKENLCRWANQHAALAACVDLYKPMISHKSDCVCMHCKALAALRGH